MSRAGTLKVVLANPPNAEASLAALRARRTSSDRMFVRSHFPVPRMRASTWRLSVVGEVDRPTAWSYAELNRLPSVQVTATVECAGNSRSAFPIPAKGELRWGDGAVGTAVWEGVSLSSLLREAGVRAGAREVVFTGADSNTPSAGAGARRFSRSLHVDLATSEEEIIVATRMNGAPLPPEHGYPARLVVPGWYGMAWVKWLSEITVTRSRFRGHFQATKYVYRFARRGQRRVEPVTRMRVKSLIVSPAEGARAVVGRPLTIAGKAWSGTGPIAKVEVDVGAGWRPARLRRCEGRYAWSSWETTWVPTEPGPVMIRSRATDETGASQPDRTFENDLQYGSNAVRATRVVVR